MADIETRRVIFLDLDDTLIPTLWIRGQFLFRRGQDVNSYVSIREDLDRETNWKLELAVCEFILAVREFSDHAIIVTNARSEAWLRVFESIFPTLNDTLRRCDIKLLRTNPERVLEPSSELNPADYFQYWTAAKLTEFQRVLSEIGDGNVGFDLICIGDNDFEHAAFSQLIAATPSVAKARSIKCSQGLAPRPFLDQVKVMTNLLRLWFDRGRDANIYRTEPVKIGAYLTLLAWSPKNFEKWAAERSSSESSQSTCETLSC